MKAIRIKAERYSYSVKESADDTMTVGELIYRLKDFPEDMPIIISNDNGYTFGRIWAGTVGEITEKEEEEEEEEE